jgi:hypothetical protein
MKAAPGGAQAGFGLLETLTGLIVFVLLAAVGMRAFHGVVANQKESSQIKALTDAVTVTAERLGSMSVKALVGAGSPYLAWSEPVPVGTGEYLFRYRAVPGPTVAGARDSSVVGLEVEVGPAGSGEFKPGRTFATLLAPNRGSRDGLGQYSTEAEREAESDFYASLRSRIAGVSAAAKIDNQVRLNSFSCYDKGECCGFMKAYFLNPDIKPADGLEQKCHYRCAMGGGVSVPDWNKACATDLCKDAPWKTKAQCCNAIAAGECPAGSVCANVCLDCVKENGSGCAKPVCDGWWFNDLINCSEGTLCDGSPLPAHLPGWGDVGALCKLDACRALANDCHIRAGVCCDSYWAPLARGQTPDPKMEVCATISRKEECCDRDKGAWHWQFACGTDGKIHNYKYNGKPGWYCGSPNGGSWDGECAVMKGCATVKVPVGMGDNESSTCMTWEGPMPSHPWQDPFPKAPSEIVKAPEAPKPKEEVPPEPVISRDGAPRKPFDRSGSIWGSQGGQE